MIGTKLSKGQGLGNQLFCYVTARCIAKKKGLPFSILGGETLANNIHSRCGLYFMDLDLGQPAGEEDFTNVYQEREERESLLAENKRLREALTEGGNPGELIGNCRAMQNINPKCIKSNIC